MAPEDLKKRARGLEEKGDWPAALAVHLEHLDAQEEAGEPDPGLLNRIADLEVRLGAMEEALEHYDRAIGLYREQDLAGNAVALCRKVLRHRPGRPETLLQLGEIEAARGFAAEARQYFLTHAETSERLGDREAAVRGLWRLLELFPHDPDRDLLREWILALDPSAAAPLKEEAETGSEPEPEGALVWGTLPDLLPSMPEPDPGAWGFREATEGGYGEVSLPDELPGELPALEPLAGLEPLPPLHPLPGLEPLPAIEPLPAKDPLPALEPLPSMALPTPVELAREAVARAERLEDRAGLLGALVALAEALEGAGAEHEADATYENILQLDPRHVGALRALGRGMPAETLPPPIPPAAEGSGFVDLGALVLGGEGIPQGTRWKVRDDRTGEPSADFARMLAQFKTKVAAHLPRDDARAAHDLGTAYREMGLLEEAIGMYQQALRAEPGRLPSLEMLGRCFLEQGEAEAAIRVLERGVTPRPAVEDEWLGIYYYLGVAYEAAGHRDEAREFLEKVFALDINFQDVTERLRALR